MRREISVRVFVLIIILILISVILGTYREYLEPQAPQKEVAIEIKPGESFYDLSLKLEREGVVKSASVLRKIAAADGIDRAIAPGNYSFKTGMDYAEVIDLLKKGPQIETARVTIPEGYSNKQIAKLLSDKFGFDETEVYNYLSTSKPEFESEFEFLKYSKSGSLEGFLFPDTYYFKKDEKLKNIVRALLKNFESKTKGTGLFEKNIQGLEPYEILILSSIIEKEAKLDDERAVIASVFYNRLKKNMRLQSCATVEYLYGFSKPQLTNDDLKIDSPYNTYIYAGLPPTPICNPGLKSIQAAVNPQNTRYLYFVLKDSSGRHYFAETYSEFLRAKEKAKSNR